LPLISGLGSGAGDDRILYCISLRVYLSLGRVSTTLAQIHHPYQQTTSLAETGVTHKDEITSLNLMVEEKTLVEVIQIGNFLSFSLGAWLNSLLLP